MALDIRVAGPGCKNCKELEARVRVAIEELEAEATLMKLTDFKDIAAAGVLTTPGLIIDGRVAVQGSVPSVESVKSLILAALKA